jgi:hypothetical protein
MDNFDQVIMRRFIDDNVTSRDVVPIEMPTDRTGADLAEKMRGPDTLQEADILRDRQFAQHARDIHKLYEGTDFTGTEREAAEYGLEIMGEFYFNFAGPGIGDNPGTIMQAAKLIASGTEDTANSFLYMLDQYEQLPNWTGSGLARAFNGIFSDPTTYAGLFTLGGSWLAKKLAGGAAREGVRLSLQNIAKNALSQKGAVGAVTRTAAEYPARVTAGTTAFQGGVSDIAEQSIEVEAGIERDVTDRITQNLLVTGISGVAGYGMAKGAGVVGNMLSDAATSAAPIIDQAGQAAEARMAERGPITDRLMSGGDPMDVVDPALAAAGKLVRPTKENPVTAVAPTETEPGIIAFHGSGADFDQFSLEKIGTGEGAQAYGYGLYFTDSEDIAKFYRDAVTDPGGVPLMYKGKKLDTPWTDEIEERFADELAGLSEGEKDDFIAVLANLSQINLKSDAPSLRESSINQGRQQRIFDKIINDVEQPDLGEGKMYKVGLEPNPDDMLNYQTTFADQPKKVQDALKAIGYEVEKNLVGQKKPKTQIDLAMRRPMPMILDSLKKRIIEDIRAGKQDPGRADKILSEKLLKQGIPGIKYRAAGSRGASVDAADVKMNYVIFDDKAIKILEKYGIVGPVAVTALGTAKQQDGNDRTQNEAM